MTSIQTALLCCVLSVPATSLFAQSQSTPNPIKKMKKFILIIRLPSDYGQAQAKAVRPAWTSLTDRWKADGIFVTSFIAPSGGNVVTGAKTGSGPVVCDGFKMISNIVVRAADLAEATKLAQQCPVLEQGGSVEVREAQVRPEVVNRETIRNLYDVILNERRLGLLDDIISPDYAGFSGVKGVEAFSGAVAAVIAGFPDIRWTIDDIFAADDKVAVRWHWHGTHSGSFRGMQPTNKPVNDTGNVIYQLKEGRIVNAWIQTDRLAVLAQIGIISPDLTAGQPANRK